MAVSTKPRSQPGWIPYQTHLCRGILGLGGPASCGNNPFPFRFFAETLCRFPSSPSPNEMFRPNQFRHKKNSSCHQETKKVGKQAKMHVRGFAGKNTCYHEVYHTYGRGRPCELLQWNGARPGQKECVKSVLILLPFPYASLYQFQFLHSPIAYAFSTSIWVPKKPQLPEENTLLALKLMRQSVWAPAWFLQSSCK